MQALYIFYTSEAHKRLHDENDDLFNMSDCDVVDKLVRELQGNKDTDKTDDRFSV